MPTRSTRRAFLQSTAATTLALGVAPAVLHAADDKAAAPYTVALIGCGWWGTHILKTALADADQAQLMKCEAAISKLTSDTPKTYTDYRELLQQARPQLVIVATPDH